MFTKARMLCVTSAIAICSASSVQGEGADVLDAIEVVGSTPTHGVGLPAKLIPSRIQRATKADLERSQSLDITQFLSRNLGSVTLNDAQNNPLQPDVQYRGFTASPLLGLPQGISIYQNGVRVNEAFGDTVNWDLIPQSAIGSINVVSGSNPLFGLNTLGGAISLRTKNGFDDPGHGLEASGGSFGRFNVAATSGGSTGNWGYFVSGEYFKEDGWRDFSDSDAKKGFASLGWRSDDTTLDLSLTVGETDLTGNGASPEELLELDRTAVFTHPDNTRNELATVTLEGTHWVNDFLQLSGNAYVRKTQTNSFNGDGTEFEECEGTSAETALLADPDDFLCEDAGEADEELVRDQNGGTASEDFNAINNISERDQDTYGGSGQATWVGDVAGRPNQFLVGVSFDKGDADFESEVELAELTSERGTTRSGQFVPEEEVRVSTETKTYSIYLSNTLEITDQLALTLSGRYNHTDVEIRDQTGEAPELNGDHTFARFNPAIGLTFEANDSLQFYGGYSESNRAPSPVELACADPDAPCNLPNAFLADPPLDDVVAKTVELGLRGAKIMGLPISWSFGLFHTINQDDIIFISTGGVTSNEGFFDNIGDTRRQGVEIGLAGEHERVSWQFDYTFLDATFRDSFDVSSPNHPRANAEGEIRVSKGDRIPGLAQHSLKLGVDYSITPKFRVGAEAVHNSAQYLRGDEANLLGTVDGYTVFNLRAQYDIHKNITLLAKIDNVFDAEYETFGLLGEPDEVLGDDFENPIFLGPGAPFGGWLGVRAKF
ncbi:MAG: TonB-dependent receptor [Pseudomonadota bacterium]